MLDLKTTLRVNMLLDFYGNLLTDKQRTYLEVYFKDNLSLSEIASNFEVSRNAIHDNLNRSLKILENYEIKLKLLEKFNKRSKYYDEIKEKWSDPKLHHYIKQLEELE